MNRSLKPVGLLENFGLNGIINRNIFVYTEPDDFDDTDDQLKCSNCSFYNPSLSVCNLYLELNAVLPDLFGIDIHVNENACCTAIQEHF